MSFCKKNLRVLPGTKNGKIESHRVDSIKGVAFQALWNCLVYEPECDSLQKICKLPLDGLRWEWEGGR